MQIKSGRWNWRAPHTSEIQVESGDGIREVQPNKNWQLKGSRESGDEIGEVQPNQKEKKRKGTKVLGSRVAWF